jgi:hypothetical protein
MCCQRRKKAAAHKEPGSPGETKHPSEGVREAELHLPLRGVRAAFGRHLAEHTAGRVVIGRIPVGMICEIECFPAEGQRMIVVPGNLLQN